MRTQLRENVSLFTKSMSRWIQLTPRGVQIYRINAKEFQGVGRPTWGVMCHQIALQGIQFAPVSVLCSSHLSESDLFVDKWL